MSAKAITKPFHKCIEYLHSIISKDVSIADSLFYRMVLKYISSVCFIYKVPGVEQEHLDKLCQACEHFKVLPVDSLYNLHFPVDHDMEFRNMETSVLHGIYTHSNFRRVREFIDICSTEKIKDLLWFAEYNSRVTMYIRTQKGVVDFPNVENDSHPNCYLGFLRTSYSNHLGYVPEAQDTVTYQYVDDMMDFRSEKYGINCYETAEKYIDAAKEFANDVAEEVDRMGDDSAIPVERFLIFMYCSVNRIPMSDVIF